MTRVRIIRASAAGRLLLLIAIARLAVADAHAVTPAPGRHEDRAKAADRMPVYKPPAVGAPSSTVGGATRGGDTAPVIVLLAPHHVGLTTQVQPTLYWHLAAPVSDALELTLSDARPGEAVQRVALPSGLAVGLHPLRLADHQIRLQQDVDYEWSIGPVSPSSRPDAPVIARAAIRRIDAPPALVNKLRHASQHDSVFIYAAGGIWYDALDAVSAAIAARPDDAVLCAERTALLSQIGQSNIVTCDRP